MLSNIPKQQNKKPARKTANLEGNKQLVLSEAQRTKGGKAEKAVASQNSS